MSTKRDDTRAEQLRKLFFDVVGRIEALRRRAANAEAMSHAADTAFEQIPYVPRLPHTIPRRELTVDDIEQSAAIGRLHAYITATAESVQDVLGACDDLLVHVHEQLARMRAPQPVERDLAGPVAEPDGGSGAARATSTPERPLAGPELTLAVVPDHDRAVDTGDESATAARAGSRRRPEPHRSADPGGAGGRAEPEAEDTDDDDPRGGSGPRRLRQRRPRIGFPGESELDLLDHAAVVARFLGDMPEA
ncbi:hypothetical protein [Haliangium sp.]|uniref:hypothetical protein n=1 Tax=Haliangium sp. TaxID=2663208 RepID=UPI003D0C4162